MELPLNKKGFWTSAAPTRATNGSLSAAALASDCRWPIDLPDRTRPLPIEQHARKRAMVAPGPHPHALSPAMLLGSLRDRLRLAYCQPKQVQTILAPLPEYASDP